MKRTKPTDSTILTGPVRVRNNWHWPRRAAKREEAILRQASYDTLPLLTKISRAEGHRGESKKELAKLRAQL